MISPKERRELRRLKRKIVQHQYKIQEDKKSEVKKDNMGCMHFFMAFAFLIGFFMLIQFGMFTVITFWNITKIFAVFLAIGLLIPLKWYRKKWTMNIYEYFLVNLLGIAPLFTGIIFFFNFLFSHHPHKESYDIESISEGTFYAEIHLSDNTFEDYNILVSMDDNEYKMYKGAKQVEYFFLEGGLGMKILVSRDFKY